MEPTIIVCGGGPLLGRLLAAALARAGHRVTLAAAPGQLAAHDGSAAALVVDVDAWEFWEAGALPALCAQRGPARPTIAWADAAEEQLARRARAAGAVGYACRSWSVSEQAARIAAALPPSGLPATPMTSIDH